MAKSGRRVRAESEAGSVVVSLQWRNYLWQNLEEGCGLKARLGVCVCVCVWGGGGGSLQWRNHLWQSLEEGCGLKAGD